MEKATKPVSYRILSCREVSFEKKPLTSGKLNAADISFKYGGHFKPDRNHLAIVLVVNLLVDGELSIKVESETKFEVVPFDAAFDVSTEGRIVDHVGIMPTLFGLAFSSIRGMLAVRTAGTPLENYPLPLINAVDATNKILRK